MRKMMKVDGIEEAMHGKKGKNGFRRAIRDLTKRSSSNQDMMKKGLNSRFSLKDLPKYS